MNALKRLDSKQWVVFLGTLVLSLVSFFTLLPESNALPDSHSAGKSQESSLSSNTGAMPPTAPVNGQGVEREGAPRLLEIRPERVDPTPLADSQDRA